MNISQYAKPCPFCGNERMRFERVEVGGFIGIKWWRLYCSECGCATGIHEVQKDCLEVWNRRVEK